MIRSILLVVCLLSFLGAMASHIVGGEMIYEYIGPGSSAGTKKYRITLRLFRDEHCEAPCALMPTDVFIGIFSNDNNRQYPSDGRYFDVGKKNETSVATVNLPPCVVNPPELDYHMAEYELTVDLPDNNNGYTATYQTCCRVNVMTNVQNAPNQGQGTGATYTCIIPGLNQLPANEHNSSPQFFIGISPICHGKPFQLDFRAKDPDGSDSLVYSFCEAYNGGDTRSAENVNPAPPPYGQVPYIGGFNSSNPFGTNAMIDAKTGLITGIAPPEGEYVVCVCINEYRGGKLIGTHRKDFIVNVEDCDFAGAQLHPSYTVCESLTASFFNENGSPLNKTFYWDFGDGSFSTDVAPTHNYPDTGTYNIKLVINRNDPCGDSATAQVKLYPFFKPDLSVSGLCVNKPTSFEDKTTATYGSVNSWLWDFGDPATNADTSSDKNPVYTYTQTGAKDIRLISTSSKGCIDTAYKSVNVFDRPLLDVKFNDTLVCNGDQIQLEAIGTGDFSWLPDAGMNHANTATPIVTPAITTNYVVTLDNDGCINTDTVQVRVVNTVTVKTLADTIICATDSLMLSAVTDGLKYQWEPSTGMDDPTLLAPHVAPSQTTTYRITASIGRCLSTDEVLVTVVPYPKANAGLDTTICYNSTAQLQGSMIGRTFSWSPLEFLTNSSTLNPTVIPQSNTSFILTVYDSSGCNKPGRDTVVVFVLPKVNASVVKDTSVVTGQPLQLLASGGTGYKWSPATGLNNTDIANPVAVYDGNIENIRYQVVVNDDAGCKDSAIVQVRVFKTSPQIFVPTAFTPNGDNINDIFRPIAAGIRRIDFFRVYNRWGELVFSTTENGKGWDGRINGKTQASGTYVWLVKGIDFTGKEFSAKGTVTLIR